jgi:hypothetical protein
MCGGADIVDKESLLSGLIVSPKWVKRNPKEAGMMAGAGLLTAMTMGGAAPALAGAGAAGAATAAGTAPAVAPLAGLGGGTAALFGGTAPASGLATSLLATEATPMITAGLAANSAPFAMGATTAAPGAASLFSSPGISAGKGLLSRLNNPATRMGMDMMGQGDEEAPPPSPQMTNAPMQPTPSYGETMASRMPQMGGLLGMSGEMDEEQKRRMLLQQMGVM